MKYFSSVHYESLKYVHVNVHACSGFSRVLCQSEQFFCRYTNMELPKYTYLSTALRLLSCSWERPKVFLSRNAPGGITECNISNHKQYLSKCFVLNEVRQFQLMMKFAYYTQKSVLIKSLNL